MSEPHLAQRDFEQFIETIAENNRTRDGSDPSHVANVVIASPMNLGSSEKYDYNKFTVSTAADPYFETRAWPMEIIRGSNELEMPVITKEEYLTLREMAVKVVKNALCKYYDETGWE